MAGSVKRWLVHGISLVWGLGEALAFDEFIMAYVMIAFIQTKRCYPFSYGISSCTFLMIVAPHGTLIYRLA